MFLLSISAIMRSDSGCICRPGSFGCHELLDRTALVSDLLQRHVLTHPACALNPDWYALADQAAAALCELYQQIGAAHLGAKDADNGAS